MGSLAAFVRESVEAGARFYALAFRDVPLEAIGLSPLSRASRPFIGPILKVGSGSRLCENVGWVRIPMD